jgi:hypothetical protein
MDVSSIVTDDDLLAAAVLTVTWDLDADAETMHDTIGAFADAVRERHTWLTAGQRHPSPAPLILTLAPGEQLACLDIGADEATVLVEHLAERYDLKPALRAAWAVLG